MRLASDGGLDYQRRNLLKGTEKQKQDEEIGNDEFLIEDVDKDENCVTKEHMEEDQETYARILPASSIEKRISAMEEKLDILLNKCAQLESDNQQLTKELALKKDGSKSNKVEASFDEEENLHNLKKRGFIRPGPQVQSESKSNKSVVTCEECNCVLESQGLLD